LLPGLSTHVSAVPILSARSEGPGRGTRVSELLAEAIAALVLGVAVAIPLRRAVYNPQEQHG
jgi:hypothetical protein